MLDRNYIVMAHDEPVSSFENYADAFALAEMIKGEGERASDMIRSCPHFLSWPTIRQMAGEADGDDS